MNGLLLVDKPSQWTSFDVVKKVRNISGERKVGHTGTLDPLATGLLILTLGSACKQASQFIKLDKTYQVEMKLGFSSETGDSEGLLRPVSVRRPSRHEITSVLGACAGKHAQIPPKYSAIKIKGVPAYKRARRGEKFELKPRNIEIKSINLISYKYPLVRFDTDVTSGTYIRSLVQDIGAQLASGAYTSNLYRSRIGGYSIQDAIIVKDLSQDLIKEHLLPLAR